MPDELDPPDPAEHARQLEATIAQLRGELRAARESGDATSTELAGLKSQLADALRELEAERARHTPPPPAPRRMNGFFEEEQQ